MDNTYTPLVSDERLHPSAFLGVNSWSGKEEMITPKSMTPEEVRDTYEKDRKQTHAELAELRAENERIREEVRGLSVEQGKDLLRAINAGAWERIDGALRVNAVSQEHVTQCFKDIGIELEPPF